MDDSLDPVDLFTLLSRLFFAVVLSAVALFYALARLEAVPAALFGTISVVLWIKVTRMWRMMRGNHLARRDARDTGDDLPR